MADTTSSTGQYASQLGMQVGANAASGLLSNLTNRLFAKKDRKTNWEESQRYGERQMDWEKDMATYNQQISKELADYNQGLTKEYYDYTSEYESAANQVKRLKEAGLNPALMYSNGTASNTGGQTGGAQAAPVRAEAPQEKYRPMGMGEATGGGMPISIRETPAERELKLAQARNLDSETQEREGVGKNLKEAQTESILEGINNERAKTALIKAQTLAVELENKLAAATWENEADIVSWTSKQVKTNYEIAMDEAYISKETRDSKIKLLERTLINSVIESSLKRATIQHLGTMDNETEKNIELISRKIGDIAVQWTLSGERLTLDKMKHELDKQTLELKKEYPGMSQYIGKILDQSTLSIFNGTGAIYKFLGIEKEAWK